MVRVVGLEPTSACQGIGFKDRCVYQFHHTRSLMLPRHRSGLDAETMAGFFAYGRRKLLGTMGEWWPANPNLQAAC